MKTIRHSRVVPIASAIVLLFQVSTGFADESNATTKEHRRRVEMTLTKWLTAYPLMAGLVEGEARADYPEGRSASTSSSGGITAAPSM